MKVLKEIEEGQKKKSVGNFKVGDTVKVFSKILEGGKERLQGFEGIIIKRSGHGARENFTVRKLVQGIGVERTFPIHSPRVDRVELIKSGKVNRAKLYYLRKRIGSRAIKVDDAVVNESAAA
ncbi:50S ribosomal protein L19 [candidate division WOR-1 bacterium RIFOXYB2_FULL_48_7]|uniref:Large ribosomal subunit protein bL19 n=1 Tax=candidate division WOR-1 bacterium RIFOXYB2_FULL_48_7 TaxID=1802583 RepID=A0A1F4TD58_UNCSA|nr:MAG: 50S ribosomal protein L19 [candidate division WOR-1 bacterium RIFOXYB2_FULL_48_7]